MSKRDLEILGAVSGLRCQLLEVADDLRDLLKLREWKQRIRDADCEWDWGECQRHLSEIRELLG